MEKNKFHFLASIPVTVDRLKSFLELNYNAEISGYSNNFKDLKLYLDDNWVDILILDDAFFYKPDFLDWIGLLTKSRTSLKTLIYTGSFDASYLGKIIDNGVWGVLHKKSNVEKVIEAVNIINIGGIYIDSVINYTIFQKNITNGISNGNSEPEVHKEKKKSGN